MTDLAAVLRAHGKRLTPQRRRVVDALARLGHATPDQVVAHLAGDGGAALPASTVYRALEALEGLGIVAHTHLDHRAPTYQLADHGPHVHLVCLGCHAVDEVPVALAAQLVDGLAAQRGFRADITHMAVHGWCASCEGPR